MFLALNLSAAGVWATRNNGDLHFDAIVAFFTLWYLVILTGRVSYAQFNPALTLVWLFRSQKGHFTRLRYGFPYFAAEFIGAILGGLIVWWIKDQVGYPSIPDNSNVAKACVFEILGSFTLISVILIVSEKDTKVSDILAVNGIIIGLGLIVTIFLTQGVSGAGINPAVSFGLTLAEYARTGNSSVLDDLWIYMTMPLIGAFIALLFHELNVRKTLIILAPKEPQKRQETSADNIVVKSQVRLVDPAE